MLLRERSRPGLGIVERSVAFSAASQGVNPKCGPMLAGRDCLHTQATHAQTTLSVGGWQIGTVLFSAKFNEIQWKMQWTHRHVVTWVTYFGAQILRVRR
jgi:hypothetical protein